MTAETPSDTEQRTTQDANGALVARSHVLVGAVLLVVGAVAASVAALQLALPDLGSGIAFMTYGRLAPASKILLVEGWAVIGLLGLSYFVITSATGEAVKRRLLATTSLWLIAVGSTAGAIGIILGLSSGVSGLESPLWARAIVAVGVLLAALSITATAKVQGDKLGAAGWYVVAAPIMLTLTSFVGLVPAPDGVPGLLHSSFTNAGLTLFIITSSVGLIYFVFGSISGSDGVEARPLAALGFWSLILVWAFMSGTDLIYSAAPNWLETIAVAFAIGAFLPALAIAADIGLMIKGTVANITDRSSLRYASVAGMSLIGVVVVNFLLTFPASSSISQFTGWVTGLDALVIVGGASFAIFSGHSVLNGGSRSGTTFHFSWSTLGLVLVATGALAGGIATGFSWAAGPTSQKFPNWGPGWEVTANTLEPFIWITAIGLVLFAVAQVVFVIRAGATNDEVLETPDTTELYDLEFSGDPKYLTWKRLVRGVTVVWIGAVAFTLLLPMVDDVASEASLLGDTYRVYESGTPELAGRNLYISEGCVQCHTQEVRPVATDVGLGAVSVAGDYAHEDPMLRGALRLGPDLFHVASRAGFSSDALKVHLEQPRAARSWSAMPSYSYLSGTDIDALVSYIETLR